MKIKILFVCLGNICRSPAAEGIMKAKLKRNGLVELFEIDSAGILSYHEGELPDSRMRSHAALRDYVLDSCSRPVQYNDFFYYDRIIGMDERNISKLNQMAPDLESKAKISRMTDYCRCHSADYIPDPYHEGSEGFELVLDLLEDACDGLIEDLAGFNQ